MRRLEVGGKWMIALAITALIVSGCSQTSSRTSQGQSSMAQVGDAKSATLTGAQEVPAVNTQATGVSTIQVFGDKNVTGSIQTSNIDGTAPHVWSVQPNTQLSSAQFDAYRAGELYVNVHSAAHPGGEIRAQLNRP